MITNLKFKIACLSAILLSTILLGTEKPVSYGDGMNLQKDYPVVPIIYGTSSAGLRTTSDCWSSLGTGYVHINDKFVGQGSQSNKNDLDDGSYGPIPLGFDYTFYGETYNALYINVNGNITFGSAYSAYSPSGFPSSTVPAMIAPFWGDVDLRGTGSGINNVYVKQEAGKFIVQWVQVGYYKESTDPRNTFQVVLTDGNDPDIGIGYNTRFAYGDMNWGVGNASGGTSGFGTTTYATVGAQANGGDKFYQIGLFGQNNANYDGPGGSIDGVHYLDGRCFTMDLKTLNIPPIANDLPEDRQINLSVGTHYNLSTSYSAPESDQIATVDISNSTLSNFTAASEPGNLSLQSFSFTPNQNDVGSHYIYIHAYDNGIPSASAHDTILVNVYAENNESEGKALAFDGVNDYVFVPHTSAMYSSYKGSFSFWIKPSSSNTNQIETVLQKQDQYEITFDRSTSKIQFSAWKQGDLFTLETSAALTKEQWNHIAFTYNGNKIDCFVNGEHDSHTAFNGFPDNSVKPLLIGTNNTKDRYFQGTIDELTYLGSAFDQERIRKLMFELAGVTNQYEKRYYFKCSKSLVLTDESESENNGILHGFDTSICWKRNYASIWNGSFSSSWSAAENWETGLVPLVTDNGAILKENYVVIPKLVEGNNALSVNESIEVNDLIIQDSSFFTLQASGEIAIKGDFHGNKGATFLGNLNFNGNTTQRIFGTNKLSNLIIDNDVYLEDDQQIVSDIMLNSEMLYVNGQTLTLLSDTSETAEIYHNGGGISGPVVAQRTLSYKEDSKGWHYLTSPVIGATFAQINERLPLRGFGKGPNDNPWPNVYLYDETVPNQDKLVGWWSPDSMNQVIQHLQGFILFYNQPQPITVSFTGEIHTGQKKRKITNTNSNRVESDGWNLVGNPYPSMLNWDLISFSADMNQALYVYDNKTDRYSSYVNGIGVNGGTAEVATFQSFFVKSSAETIFTLENNNRTTGKNKGWFRTANLSETIKIRLTKGASQDEVVVVNDASASAAFDTEKDAYKLQGSTSFEVFLKWDNTKFSIKNFPIEENTKIPLYLNATMGNYSLSIEENLTFCKSLKVFVEDLVSKETFEISNEKDFNFETAAVEDNHRFNIILKTAETSSTNISNFKSEVSWGYNSNQLHLFDLPTNSTIEIFDANGKLLTRLTSETEQSSLIIPWKYSKGVFFVKVADQKPLKISLLN